jgi:hypothetical protein
MNHSVDAALTAPQISPLELGDMRIIGESQQQWAAFRRKYNLFNYRPIRPPPSSTPDTKLLESGQTPTSNTTALTEATVPDAAIEAGMTQFAYIDEPLLSWDFTLRSEDNSTIGSVNRNFSGFAREIFTETGVYALRMDRAVESVRAVQQLTPDDKPQVVPMSLDARAVMLATAVSIDFDYFSDRSGRIGPSPMFWPMPWGGGGGAGTTGTDTDDAARGGGVAGSGGVDGMEGGASQDLWGDDEAPADQPFLDDDFD